MVFSRPMWSRPKWPFQIVTKETLWSIVGRPSCIVHSRPCRCCCYHPSSEVFRTGLMSSWKIVAERNSIHQTMVLSSFTFTFWFRFVLHLRFDVHFCLFTFQISIGQGQSLGSWVRNEPQDRNNVWLRSTIGATTLAIWPWPFFLAFEEQKEETEKSEYSLHLSENSPPKFIHSLTMFENVSKRSKALQTTWNNTKTVRSDSNTSRPAPCRAPNPATTHGRVH